MLKKIIKTHTARLDFVDIIKPTFLRNAVATNRQRRVIASDNCAVPPQKRPLADARFAHLGVVLMEENDPLCSRVPNIDGVVTDLYSDQGGGGR